MTPFHRAFIAWEASRDNPLVNASDSIKHSIWPALRAAFRAGIEYERNGDHRNIFAEDEDDIADN
jgi:hypothetical protein